MQITGRRTQRELIRTKLKINQEIRLVDLGKLTITKKKIFFGKINKLKK